MNKSTSNKTKAKKKKIQFDRIFFTCGVIVLSFVYGYVVHLTQMFPYEYLKKTEKAALILYAEYISHQLPWYYHEAAGAKHKLVTYKKGEVSDGLTLITSIDADSKLSVKIIDFQGKIIHEWPVDWFKLWPNPTHLPDDIKPQSRPGTHIDGIVLMPDGDIIFNFQYCGLIRLNPCGEVVWRLPYQTHHSINIDSNGNLWVPGRKRNDKPNPKYKNYVPPFEEETILEVSPDGKILRAISVLGLLIKNGLQGYMYMEPQGDWSTKTTGDTMHLNDIEPFPANFKEGFFTKDDIMISLRNINTVLVFNRHTQKIKFVRTGNFVRQHDPDFVDGNTISVFDNNHIAPEVNGQQSRILIMSALDSAAKVYYTGSKRAPFYSVILGKHQWLPNGNLLIADAVRGRVIEINKDRQIIWEYINIVKSGLTGTVEDAQRIPKKYSITLNQRKRECK